MEPILDLFSQFYDSMCRLSRYTNPGYEKNFHKESLETVDSRDVRYDYGSVMHYGAFFFTKNAGEETIHPKEEGAEIGQRIGLSELDIEQALRLYECDKGEIFLRKVLLSFQGTNRWCNTVEVYEKQTSKQTSKQIRWRRIWFRRPDHEFEKIWEKRR